MKLLVETAARTGTPMASTITGTLRKPPPTPSRPETAPATPRDAHARPAAGGPGS